MRTNDEHLLKRLYRDGFLAIKEYVARHNGTKNDAYDVYQRTLLATRRNVQWARFSSADESVLRAYQLRVGKNKWIDELRKPKADRAMIRNNIETDQTFDPTADEHVQTYGFIGARS